MFSSLAYLSFASSSCSDEASGVKNTEADIKQVKGGASVGKASSDRQQVDITNEAEYAEALKAEELKWEKQKGEKRKGEKVKKAGGTSVDSSNPDKRNRSVNKADDKTASDKPDAVTSKCLNRVAKK